MKTKLTIVAVFILSITFGQNKIVGFVRGATGALPGVKVKIIGDEAKSFTDVHGAFELYSDKKFPFTLDISCAGYEFAKVDVKTKDQIINISLITEDPRFNEIIVAASRTPEKIKESPVTIERLSIKDIKKTTSINFYDGLENIKEVHINTPSLTFKSINTRGFASSGNTRFLQLIDGKDNSSSSLNFVFGNILGVSEIDVQNIEILPGPSSALYGANAFNGILFINTQNPFSLQGVTAYVKYGHTAQNVAGTNQYYDYGIRAAKAFSKHFAAKANFTFLRGTEWHAANYADVNNPQLNRTYKNYDGLNVYGDEVNADIASVGRKIALANPGFAPLVNLLANQGKVSRTGYNEVDLTDNIASNTKIDFSLHFKPWANDIELIWQSKFGMGNAVHQGANRYNLNNFFMQQHGLEIRGKRFFVRAYQESEDAKGSYDMKFTGININRLWKTDANWFTDYTVRYAQAVAGFFGPSLAGNSDASHTFARTFADTGRLQPGTSAFKNAFNTVISNPNVQQGSQLLTNCGYNHVDANYSAGDMVKFAEILFGGSYRRHNLDSDGRIYTDYNGKIVFAEYGLYLQAQKKLMNDRLKLTASLRHDKSDNFAGNFSPRFSAVYAAGAMQKHIFRASLQTGFRNPSTQEQYIGLNIGSAVLLGSAEDNLNRFTETIPLSAAGAALAGNALATINGYNAYFNSYTAASVTDFGTAISAAAPTTAAALAAAINNASGLLQKSNSGLVKPELVKSFDIGYRTKAKGFVIDASAYYNQYTDFIGAKYVLTPLYGTATSGGNFVPGSEAFKSAIAIINEDRRSFGIYTNTDVEIKSYGFGLGLNKKLLSNYELGLNYNLAKFDYNQAQDPTFIAGFNTPEHRIKASISGEKVLGTLGFAVNYRWADSYLYESTFAVGMIDAASVIDAQLNYTFSKAKSTFKIGATNLGGRDYFTVYGAGAIGKQYYASWTINP